MWWFQGSERLKWPSETADSAADTTGLKKSGWLREGEAGGSRCAASPLPPFKRNTTPLGREETLREQGNPNINLFIITDYQDRRHRERDSFHSRGKRIINESRKGRKNRF